MDAVIWKYRIPTSPGSLWVTMPVGAAILKAGVQVDGLIENLVVWVLGVPEQGEEKRLIETQWTGTPFEAKQRREYIDTVQMQSGLVCHLFEILEG